MRKKSIAFAHTFPGQCIITSYVAVKMQGRMNFLVSLLSTLVLFSLQKIFAEAANFRGDLRLVGGSYQWEGRVEIYMSGSWGTITDSNWTSHDAQALCRALGYFRPGARAYSGAYFGQGSGPIHLDHIVCSGTEYNLTECETGTGTRQSSHTEDVGVKCNTADDVNRFKIGDIRLVGGANNSEGRVELNFRGEWGTISSSDWTLLDATVVCRQLGLSTQGVEAVCCSGFGAGTGPVHISSIQCTGQELNITNCPYQYSVIINHDLDVGVRCGPGSDYKEGDVRLVGGSYSWEGRVEIFLDGLWGTITYGSADSLDAHVVCRQLGYDTRFGYSGISYTYTTKFGRGSGAIHLNYLRCYGSEQRLTDCRSQTNTWSHYSDWSISCINDSPSEGDVKLYYNARDSDYYEGVVQVFSNGKWGVIRDDNEWSMEDVNVVCRQLGREGVDTDTYYYGYYDNLDLTLQDVRCIGNESRLIDCSYANATNDGGFYYSFASAECSSIGACVNGDVRLTGGTTEREGRVEMCNYRSMWGTVCGTLWSPAHSRVVCRNLGFSDESAEVFQRFAGDDKVPITADHIRCEGTEQSLKNCINFAHSYGCSHDDDIGVRCQPANCEDGEVKLLGEEESQGLTLVCINRRWGTLCNSNSATNIHAVCKQMGYEGGYSRYYSPGTLPRVPVNFLTMTCQEENSRVFDCSYKLGNSSLVCSDPLAIRCYSGSCADGEVRLVDGETEMEGRVEICFSRRWGTISGDGWTNTESSVVCSDLGYELSGEEYSVRPATNSQPVFMKNVKCTGRELSLLECGYRRNLTHTSHLTDISVKCRKPECVDGEVRLVKGSSEGDGVLQVCFDQRWGTVSNDGWTGIDTQVACRQLGFNSTGRYYKTTETYALSTPIHMDNVGCHGYESKLIDCGYNRETTEDIHSEDVWIECDTDNPSTSPTDTPITDKPTTSSDNTPPEPSKKSDINNNIGGLKGSDGNRVVVERRADAAGLSVALVALFVTILLVASLVAYIIWTKKKTIHEGIRVRYEKSFGGGEETTAVVNNLDMGAPEERTA